MKHTDDAPDFVALYNGDEFVGDLIMENGEIRFEANPLASLPSGDMPNFLENLLPEGDRDRWYKALRHLPRNNIIGYFQRYGEDLAGSLSSAPRGENGGEPVDATERIEALLSEGAPVDATIRAQKSLLAGADPKLAVIWRGGRLLMPDAAHPSTHILKCGNSLCLNEHFCMSLMERCGVRTAGTELLCLGGKEALLVRRFDRKNGERLMAADFCQLAGVGSGDKYRVRWEDIGKIVRDFSEADRMELLKAAFFNIITGSSDDHAKNFSVIIENGEKRLAPMYDVASMAAAKRCSERYRHLDADMAKSVGCQKDRHRLKPVHIRMLGKILGVEKPEAVFGEMLDKIRRHAARLLAEISEKAKGMPFDDSTKKLHARFVRQMERLLEKDLRFFAKIRPETKKSVCQMPKFG